MAQLAEIGFNLNATITQKINILRDDITPEQIASALESGAMQTTIAHDGIETIGTTITETETGRIVARIIEQRVCGEHEIHTFTVYEDSDNYIED